MPHKAKRTGSEARGTQDNSTVVPMAAKRADAKIIDFIPSNDM